MPPSRLSSSQPSTAPTSASPILGQKPLGQKHSERKQHGRVLILENDYSNRILFTDYLEHCGYSVFPLADEQQILESLADYRPDVLILNLKMPFTDGFSVIEKLRSHPEWQHLSILVVSGYSLNSDKQKAYRMGANAYLTKPVFPAELSRTVAQLIESASD